MDMTRGLPLAVCIIVAASAASDVAAQTYPSRPIQLVVPFTPGGGVDFVARLLSVGFNQAFGVPVIVDNRAGAGGTLGADHVARAAPDGHTFVVGNNSTHGVNQAFTPGLPYDTVRSFTPISMVAAAPNMLLTGTLVPAKNLQEFIALAKTRPGQMNYGSSGTGSQNHLSGELFNYMAGTNITHVPFKGSIGPGLSALMAGEIQLFWASTTGATQHVATGRLRALAITGTRRSPAAPEVATFIEQGIKGFETGPWYAFLGPAGLSPAIVTRVHQEIVKIVATPDFRQKLAAQGAEPIGSTPTECLELVRDELAKWTRLVKETGMK